MIICEASEADLRDLLYVERQAFGDKEGPEIIELVKNLLSDPSARPLLSLVAVDSNSITGHILFSKARIALQEQVSAAILAPLAVIPAAQKQGIGGSLITEGLKMLAGSHVDLVFVFGHPDYYPRFNFRPAGALGFTAPYPIPAEIAGAWMVQELRPGLIGSVEGKVICADELNRPEYWQE